MNILTYMTSLSGQILQRLHWSHSIQDPRQSAQVWDEQELDADSWNCNISNILGRHFVCFWRYFVDYMLMMMSWRCCAHWSMCSIYSQLLFSLCTIIMVWCNISLQFQGCLLHSTWFYTCGTFLAMCLGADIIMVILGLHKKAINWPAFATN